MKLSFAIVCSTSFTVDETTSMSGSGIRTCRQKSFKSVRRKTAVFFARTFDCLCCTLFYESKSEFICILLTSISIECGTEIMIWFLLGTTCPFVSCSWYVCYTLALLLASILFLEFILLKYIFFNFFFFYFLVFYAQLTPFDLL